MTGRTYKQSLCIHCSVNRSQHPHAGAPKPTAVFPFAWRKNSKEGAGASETHLLGKWFQAPHNILADPRILNATKCNAADTQAICLVAPLWFRLDISMLGSLMQCNTRGRRRGVQGEGGLEARVCCVCSCAPKVEMIEQQSGVPKVHVHNDKSKRPPVVHAGRWPLAHSWQKYSKAVYDCGSVSAYETERQAACRLDFSHGFHKFGPLSNFNPVPCTSLKTFFWLKPIIQHGATSHRNMCLLWILWIFTYEAILGHTKAIQLVKVLQASMQS